MTATTTQNGWVTLSNGFDVELLHGIPIRLSNNGLDIPADDAQLVEEVSKRTELTVVIKGWEASKEAGEQEAALCVDALQFEEVLRRLALASAALFVDRYHEPIERDSVDWDNAEYARDFNHAVDACCLDPGEMNRADYVEAYVSHMHVETRRLLDSGESPMVEAEDD
jgi:hypothetical protein